MTTTEAEKFMALAEESLSNAVDLVSAVRRNAPFDSTIYRLTHQTAEEIYNAKKRFFYQRQHLLQHGWNGEASK